MRMLRRAYYRLAYYLSWALFFGVGVPFNLVCLPLLLLPRRHGRTMRRALRSLFDFWMRWFHFSGVVRIHWQGFDAPLTPGTIYIANHPTLIDAPILLSRIPDAICIFKPALMRNPAVGPVTILAGYAAGNSGVDMIRDVAAKIAAGQSLVIFPEGTRTEPGQPLNPLKPGFALIAARAKAPVQLLIIRAPSDLVPRRRPWWKAPDRAPSTVTVSLDRRWPYDPARSPQALTDAVAAHLVDRLRESA